MSQFNISMFINKLSKNQYILSIKEKTTNTIEITYMDGQVVFLDTIGDDLHKFYTFIPKNDNSMYYIGKMPHDTYDDLYKEINRMNTPNSRKTPCKYPYFKCDDLFM